MGLETGDADSVTVLEVKKTPIKRRNMIVVKTTKGPQKLWRLKLHACQLFKEAQKNNVKFSSYVGDDDSTALAELVKQTPYMNYKSILTSST